MKNNDYIPIMVTGPYTCGKGALISLLDSSTILAIPQWHDMLVDIFYYFIKILEVNKHSSWRGKDERIIILRKLLSERDYPMLEQYALQKKLVYPISSNNFEFFDFDFDYYNQSKEFFEQIYNLNLKDITFKNVFNLFIQTFVHNFKNLPSNNTYKYFVSASEPGFCDFDKLIEVYPNIKIIYINRPDWIFSYAERLNKEQLDAYNCIFNDKRFDGIIKTQKNCYQISQCYPDNFKVIEFNDLIENTTSVMPKIITFLGIEWNEIYLSPTFLTQDIKSQQIVGKILDNNENLSITSDLSNYLKEEFYSRSKILLEPFSQENVELLYKKNRHTSPIITKDISVVVQGAVDKKKTLKCLKSLRKKLPDAEIILSTWIGSDVTIFKGLYDILVFNDDPGSYNMSEVTWKTNNVNRQIVSTINGVKKATRKYVLKLRTDLVINNTDFLKHYNEIMKNPLKREKPYSVFKNRVMIDTYFTRNSEYNSCTQCGLCFHPSDLWLFGLKDDIENLFDIPLQNEFIVNLNGIKFQYRTPEQYIWTSCLNNSVLSYPLLEPVFPEPILLSSLTLVNVYNFAF